ncbi:class I SAM-dependent methyltransferase [Micromonospora sp. NBC_01699]|uniref:class I SAM-dependent methyltransferase n=1 Tax=Micromonospora sp. NBC_01699 TaxID=2975984 RepID=UPI002E31E701|nr:class I SAM-dependent methyltransferase [Micromonospora sp. NBC_01699]
MVDTWIARTLRRRPTDQPAPAPRPHFTRYVMYDRLKSVVTDTIDRRGGAGLNVLAISGSVPFAGHIGLADASIVEANYPEFDMLALSFPDDHFDVVLSDQVLEHVEGDPFVAFRESVRVTRPGGYVIHTTCFFNEIHCAPQDFWRFTPQALRLLCRGVADPVEVGGWGNLALLPLTRLGLRFRPVPSARWHPLHRLAVRDNPKWPITTWLVARKPGRDHHG